MVNAVCQLGDLIAPGHGQRFGQVTAGNVTNMGDDATERVQQDMANAVPDRDQHNDQRQRQHRHLPFRKAVVILAFSKRGVIQIATDLCIFPQRRAEGVLHPLRRLREIGVHVAALQELNQLCQTGMVGVVFFVDILAHLLHRRLRGDFLKGLVMLCGIRKCRPGIFQQIGFRAALLIVGIHHHARGRAAQVDTRLQHQIPR